MKYLYDPSFPTDARAIVTNLMTSQPRPFPSFTSPHIRFVGQSTAMQQIEEDVESAARSDAKVLITGETGVGKDVVAHLIHQRSARVAGPLLTVNCAGLPDSLLESELFGHVRGSFTGAYRDKSGLLEMAPNGTVFLDEVGEMSVRMQVVLLRFLETGEIQRIGSDRVTKRVDVRLITATNRDLQSQISAGLFREDLYYRLNVIRLTIPPLRERVEDVPLIITHYLDVYSAKHKVSRPELLPVTLDALIRYRWPGNVRELKNIVERLVLRSRGHAIQPSDLPQEVFRSPFSTAPVASTSEAQPRYQTVAEGLVRCMIEERESFWSVVYPRFMARDLTRDDLRTIVHIGLRQTNGNYRLMTQLFNMPDDTYKRFLGFLRKHECHIPFQNFRGVPARLTPGREEIKDVGVA
jgi:transcriptional regulator with GAF, ATPase, and Fis domain